MTRSQRIELEIKRRLIAEQKKTDLDRERERSRSMREAFEQEKLALMRELDGARNLALQAFLSHSLGEKSEAYLDEIAQIAANTRAMAEVSTALYDRLKLLGQQLAINRAPEAPPARRPARKPRR